MPGGWGGFQAGRHLSPPAAGAVIRRTRAPAETRCGCGGMPRKVDLNRPTDGSGHAKQRCAENEELGALRNRMRHQRRGGLSHGNQRRAARSTDGRGGCGILNGRRRGTGLERERETNGDDKAGDNGRQHENSISLSHRSFSFDHLVRVLCAVRFCAAALAASHPPAQRSA